MLIAALIVAIVILGAYSIYLYFENKRLKGDNSTNENTIAIKDTIINNSNKHIRELCLQKSDLNIIIEKLNSDLEPVIDGGKVSYLGNRKINTYNKVIGCSLLTDNELKRVIKRKLALIDCRAEEGDIFADLDEGTE